MPATQGGGTIAFTNAANQSWIINPDGTKDLLLKFINSPDPASFVLPGASKVRILAIGGGGGGGGAYMGSGSFAGKYGGGGGGGAGGFVEREATYGKSIFAVAVGAGGAGGALGSSHGTTVNYNGQNGGDTTITPVGQTAITAYGGGGGGGESTGNAGGSGGGGSMYRQNGMVGVSKAGGTPKDATQGHAGGLGDAGMFGAGGGGAGAAGKGVTESSNNPQGGAGKQSDITLPKNTAQAIWPWYAGGGGGGWTDKTKTTAPAGFENGVLGGSGVGGNGGVGTAVSPTAGAAETGSGGGGCWAQTLGAVTGGAAGGSGVVYVRISMAMNGALKKPEMSDLVYNGADQVLVKASPGYTITVPGAGGTVLTEDYKAKVVGTYTARIELLPGLEWEEGGSDPVDFSRRIVKATLVISDLVQRDWMSGTPEVAIPEPTCTVTPYLVGADVIYTYGDSETGPFAPEKPTSVGQHWVKAEIFESDNWHGATAVASFKIINGLGNLFTDYVQIDIGSYAGTPLTNFPYKIELSEASPIGFLYERAGAMGDQLALTDADGNIYPYDVTINGTWKKGGTSTLYVRIDAISNLTQSVILYWRLRPGASAPANDPKLVWSDWTKAAAAAIAAPAYTFNLVVRDGRRVNYWTTYPSITKTSWTISEPPGVLTDGVLKEGGVSRTFVDATGAITATMPTAGGTYRAKYVSADTTGLYEPIEAHVDFRIIAHPTFDDLHGGADSLTTNGRVLLMNDDGDGVHQVTDQSYYQTAAPGRSVFWLHESPNGPHEAYMANLARFPGTHHTLCQLNWDGTTNRLWYLENVIVGNNYDPDSLYAAYQCLLPHSATGKAISDPSLTPGLPQEAGNIVMRNMVGAIVTSPVYTNGIGTLYFDALNSVYADSGSDQRFRLCVEVATGTNENWTAVSMLPLKRDGGATSFTAQPETKDLALTILTPRTENNFYRICVKVERRDAVRFRIRRLSYASGWDTDRGAFILLDNILVSYPNAEVKAEPYGKYFRDYRGTMVLGQEAAMMTPFPSVGDDGLLARVKPTAVSSPATNIDANAIIQLTTMHYRWRYPHQASNDWQTVDIWPTAGFVADDPLVLPHDEGDVDFWYESLLDLPSYLYHDYTGTGADLKGSDGQPLYTEYFGGVTNHYSVTQDWFFRLRGGKSDWERFRIYTKTSKDATAVVTNEMELIEGHRWRGFVSTPEALSDGLWVRFEGINRQTPGDRNWVTNATGYCIVPTNGNSIEPWAVGGIVEGTDWASVTCDATTGYLEFQIDDRELSYAVVHADRQDFNLWSDARVNDPANGLFVGTSTETNAMSGTSVKTREFDAPINRWHLSVATNAAFWAETFTPDPWNPRELDPGGRWEAYKNFNSETSPNGWGVGPGQWISGFYRDYDNMGMALQMQGKGKGYIQFVNSANAPRGLESISLRTRIGQSIAFNDICYYDVGKKEAQSMTDYTFFTRAAFDLANRTGFSGNGSLSLFAFMTNDGGAYEFRIEQYNGVKSSAGDISVGHIFQLSLYRWAYNATSGEKTATRLGSTRFDYTAKTKPLTTSGENGSYGGLFLAAKSDSTATYLVAGLSRSLNATKSAAPGADYDYVYYKDTSAARLICGTYGVVSANCPGRFVCPAYYAKSVTCPSDADSTLKQKIGTNPTVATTTKVSCYNDLNNGYWTANPGRMTIFTSGGESNYGLKAADKKNTLEISTAPAGTTAWTPFKSVEVSSFKSADPIVIDLWSRADCSVKIAAGGSDDTACVDLVVDDIELRQWRGESYDDKEGAKYFTDNPQWGCPNDFVFTQGWNLMNVLDDESAVTNCQLCAKRAQPGVAQSIRSPLFDGAEGTSRGLGLGMISFTYANAQPNVNLLVQIATNVDLSSLATATKETSRYWTTVTNFNFAHATDLASGVRSVYLGLHGVKGAMRIVMDDAVVQSVASETDPAKFASIDITGVLCRDEPRLDQTSWWGWNIRTTDDPLMRNLWDENYANANRHGLSFALNNGVTEEYDIRRNDPKNPKEQYKKHLPFLQTPTFRADVVGEVNFKARRYAPGVNARLTLYGAKASTVATGDDTDWVPRASWLVTNDTFRTYTYKTPMGDGYTAFRFAVTGVGGVERPTMPEDKFPTTPVARVLLDDIVVSEAVRASLSFRNVAAFRTGLENLLAITNIMDRSQQPLCGESWGVQCEIYLSQYASQGIDLSTAKVRLWWYENAQPWGFSNWTNQPGAKCVWLSRCVDSNTVFRSSYVGEPGSVMSPQASACTVQYMLELFYDTEDGAADPKPLEKSEWTKPKWYDPIDYNSGQDDFSAYTILDSVAPGWAWINEVNIFGQYGEYWSNTDRALQFLEIAAPGEADLNGWKIRFLDAQRGSDVIITNEVATFGENIPSKKTDLKGMDMASKFVFHVLASPLSTTLSPADGRCDGYWRVTDTRAQEQIATSGELGAYYPVSIQLVRRSGIVEHEVTAIGTNYYSGAMYEPAYDPQVHVDYLNAHEPGGHFVYVGQDNAGTAGGSEYGWSRSLGVHAGNGGIGMSLAEDITNYWNNTHTMTPGRLNGDQTIDPNWPRPQGTSIVIYSLIEGAHLLQTFGDKVKTNVMATLVFPKGDANGTNILYYADRFYELGAVSADGKPLTGVQTGPGTWSVAIGKYASNNISVTASADVDRRLQERYGLTADNRYREAVLDWLSEGRNAAGGEFHDNTRELPGLADFVGAAGTVVTNLSLTEMYWLDIDPTWDDHVMRYRAYFSQAPIPFEKEPGLTNVTLKVYMNISNTLNGANWAPYVLRSSTPKMTSWDYLQPNGLAEWIDVSFKVTGILVNGSDTSGKYPRENWLPLRWFVFSGGATGGVPYSSSFDANGESLIEIVDPYSKSSPGYWAGWYDWVREHGWCPVFWRWDLDDRIRPQAAEILRPDSTY